MDDPKSGSKTGSESRIPDLPEGELTLSDSAFVQLPAEERVRSGHASFLPQTILAKRFRIVRFIARGGMGEVYEAEDLELQEHVAVKCIRFEYAQQEHATERFRREIQLARRVTHPNICRTYDVFRHVEAETEGDPQEILVVSMELLSGKTLSQELREKGKLTPEEAMPIIVQLAAGLGAAHEAGVVHRDFKSANVMLVPVGREAEGVRAVITDFGLARDTTRDASKLTGTLDVIGTPAYMAPEQLNGGKITPATDIYALGIVMFEMLTGNVPYSGDTAIGMAMRRLTEAAPSPRANVPGLDPKWEATVLHCLERAPADRFANTGEIVKTIQGELKPPVRRRGGKLRMGWPQWAAAGAIAALVVALAGGGVWYKNQVSKTQTAAQRNNAASDEGKQRPSVAVLGFRNMTETASAGLLGDMLSDGLWSQLDIDEVRFITPSRVDEMKHNLGITEVASSLDSKQLARIQDYLGCETIITGSYRVIPGGAGKKVEWNIHLLGKGAGTTGGSIQQTGTESDLNGMIAVVGKLIRTKLGVELSVAEESRLGNSLSTNPEALRSFSEAREKRRRFDVSGAIRGLEKAIAADPEFAQAHSALAEAWAELGYESKAGEAAKKAMDHSSKLSAEARGVIAGRYSEMTHDWPKAIENYASLRTLFVDDPEYGLLLARAQTSAGKGQAALATLDQTQQKNVATGMSAQLDLARSEAQESLGDFHEQLKAATSATEKANSLQSKLLLARGRIQECSALINLGDAVKARPFCDEAQKLNTEAGDQLGAARAINVVANAAWQQGNIAEAKNMYEQALGIAQMIGDKIDEAGALNNLANILDSQGDREGAIRMYQKSMQVAQERDDKAGLAMAEQNLGVVYFEKGDAKAGSAMQQRAILIAREVGDKSTEATILNNLCLSWLDAGELKKAQMNCEDSLRLRTEIDSKPDVARSLVSRGSIRMAEGNLAGARKDYEDALHMQELLGQKSDIAYTQISLGRLALEEGKLADAQTLTTDAAKELSIEKDAGGEAEARALLGWAKALAKDASGAAAELAAASKLSEKSLDNKTRFRVELTAAAIDSEVGKNEEAAATLVKLEKSARGAGWVALALEAKLALGKAEIRAGQAVKGKLHLAELSRDAKARGFALISEQATKAA